KLSWFNPLSWSYLTDVYVKNNWLPVVFTVILAFIVLAFAYMFEVKRDVAAGYMPEARGKVHAGKTLQSLTGLVLRQQRTAAIAESIGLFVLRITYASMNSKIVSMIGGASSRQNNLHQRELQISANSNSTMMVQQSLAIVSMVIAI